MRATRVATATRLSMRASAALALVLGATSCGGSAPPAQAPAKPLGPKVDATTAEKDARGLVQEIYAALDHANTDSLLTLVSDTLVVFGPRRADAFPTRTDALVELHKLIDSRSKKKIKSAGLEVIPAEGGRSAWAYDVVEMGGETFSALVLLSNTDDIWLMSVAEIAQTPPMKLVRSELKKEAVIPPAMNVTTKVAPAAKGAVDRFNAGLLHQDLWGADLALRSDAVVIGPGKDNVTHGKKDIKAMWKKRLSSNVKEVAAAEVTAGATSDGQLAWVTAPVVRFEDDEPAMPLRVFAIFERSGDEWKMLALHESVTIVEPNAAVAFKKVQLPAAAPTVEAKTDAKPDAKAETKKDSTTAEKPKKKKKKKKKPVEPPPDEEF